MKWSLKTKPKEKKIPTVHNQVTECLGNIIHTQGQPCLYILYTYMIVRIVSNLPHWMEIPKCAVC